MRRADAVNETEKYWLEVNIIFITNLVADQILKTNRSKRSADVFILSDLELGL